MKRLQPHATSAKLIYSCTSGQCLHKEDSHVQDGDTHDLQCSNVIHNHAPSAAIRKIHITIVIASCSSFGRSNLQPSTDQQVNGCCFSCCMRMGGKHIKGCMLIITQLGFCLGASTRSNDAGPIAPFACCDNKCNIHTWADICVIDTCTKMPKDDAPGLQPS